MDWTGPGVFGWMEHRNDYVTLRYQRFCFLVMLLVRGLLEYGDVFQGLPSHISALGLCIHDLLRFFLLASFLMSVLECTIVGYHIIPYPRAFCVGNKQSVVWLVGWMVGWMVGRGVQKGKKRNLGRSLLVEAEGRLFNRAGLAEQ